MYGYIFPMYGSQLETYGYVLDMYWIPMDISFGYIWISFGYGLDLFRIYLRLRPGPAPARRPASARQCGRRPGVGQAGRCQWASQSACHCSSSPGHSDWAGYDASVPGGFIDDACARLAGFRNITIITSLPVLVVSANARRLRWVMENLSLLDKMVRIIIS